MPRRAVFLPRIYRNQQLTIRSDPRILINIVNNLRKVLQKRNTSTAQIAKPTGNFFTNILRRQENI